MLHLNLCRILFPIGMGYLHRHMPKKIDYIPSSVTRYGDLLDFGQLLNVFGNTQFAQILKEFL